MGDGSERKRSEWVKPYVVGYIVPIKTYELPSELTLKEIEMYLTSEGKRILDELKALKERGGGE